MSGHSKWSTIKHKKAARDHVKGNVFTKLSNAISIAVRKGGGIVDPEMNFALRLAISKAKASNMPLVNINKAIERGNGKGEGESLLELVVEGFGPSGEALIVTAITNNGNRTIGEVRLVLEKNGGTMGIPGSVMYQFERVGIVEYSGHLVEEDQLALIDLGASDWEEEGGEGVVISSVENGSLISEFLIKQGTTVVEMKIGYKPKVVHNDGDSEKLEKLINVLRELDDVQEVYVSALA